VFYFSFATINQQCTKPCAIVLRCYKQEAQLSLGRADTYVQSSASEFQLQRESDLSEMRQFHARYVDGTLSRKV